jgi:hypothetical protein
MDTVDINPRHDGGFSLAALLDAQASLPGVKLYTYRQATVWLLDVANALQRIHDGDESCHALQGRCLTPHAVWLTSKDVNKAKAKMVGFSNF